MKRTNIRKGDVFAVKTAGGNKRYFQYLGCDETQLYSDVIKVFNTEYKNTHEPNCKSVISDKVSFYAHTFIKIGIHAGVWEKCFNCEIIDIEFLENIIFGCTEKMPVDEANTRILINSFGNWELWHINHDIVKIKILPEELKDKVEIGRVKSYIDIVNRIQYGYYKYTMDEYDVLKRHPYPYIDSYTKAEQPDTTIYYHFHGEYAVREIILTRDNVLRLSTDNPEINGMKLRTSPFGDTNWKHKEFITKEEFEKIWNFQSPTQTSINNQSI